MIDLFLHLARPFGYLSIKGINGKKAYDWLAPLILSIFSLAFFYFSNLPFVDLIKDGGFIKTVASFISNLPGFYIAALAAIATFNREQIDYPLIGKAGTPFIEVKITKENGTTVNSKEDLTRRLFLCMLFAFLTALSIMIVILNAFVAPVLALSKDVTAHVIYAGIFIYLIWQLLVSTFFGLYYLGDRIHMNY